MFVAALIAAPAGLLVALLSSAIPYSLEMFALRRMPRRTFGVLMSLEPALGGIMGLFYLGESLTFYQWSAIVLVILSSAGSIYTAND